MERNECNHFIAELETTKLMYAKEMAIKCIRCGTMIGWWQLSTGKIMPIRRSWTEQECLALR
jgi:hypothetical protein